MRNKTVEMYWEIGSTNAYFAMHLIKPILAKTGTKIIFHPFNLGYVFRHHNYVLMEEPAIKIANRKRDLERWAIRYDLPFRIPTEFPIKTSRALRGSLAMRRFGLEAEYIDALFVEYWERDNASIQNYAGLRPVVTALGVDAEEFEILSESDEVRQELADSTNRGMERGVFGVPSFFVGDELYWGKDRMEFIEDELMRG